MFNSRLTTTPAYVVVCIVLFGFSFYDAINTDPNPDDAQGGLMGENITLTDTQTLGGRTVKATRFF